MEKIKYLIDFVLHIDKEFLFLVSQYGNFIYGILFLILFIETGLVIMPFLPGDSLLFVVGSLSGAGHLNVWIVIGLCLLAAIGGDTVNYHIGKYFGHKIVNRKIFGKNLIKKEHMEKTKSFYDKYGKKTIIIARFVPIVRTVAPFVAGIGEMSYHIFIVYNIIGGCLRVLGITMAGFFFGQIPFVKDNFEKVVFAIILISLLPIFIEYFKHKYKK